MIAQKNYWMHHSWHKMLHNYSTCIHRIDMLKGHKPAIENQRKLNPGMKYVVQTFLWSSQLIQSNTSKNYRPTHLRF